MSDNSNMGKTEEVKQSQEKNVHVKYSRIKRKVLKHVLLLRIFLATLAVGIVLAISSLAVNVSKNIGISNIYNFAESFIFPSNDSLQSEKGRTNILVLGIGGKGHEGSTLTDTILLVSLSLGKDNVSVVSVPRDVWIPEIRAKINSAYYWGSQKEIGGMALARTSVSEVLGVSPQYTVVIDFDGFKKIVDVLGGIEVNVINGFTDPLYPLAGKENDLCGGDKTLKCRYESITFPSGTQAMDGETALKFVRSRHSEGDEGTDTARQVRQQLVVDAIQRKILSPKVMLNPKKDLEIWNAVNSAIETDIELNSLGTLARKVFDSRNSIKKYLIPEELLVNPPPTPLFDKQYVFIPKLGNGRWKDIHTWVESILY